MELKDLSLALTYDILPRLLSDGAVSDDRGIHSFRDLFKQHGINSRGWRLYLDYGDYLLLNLHPSMLLAANRELRKENAVAFMQLLSNCEMDVPPPLVLCRTLHFWRLPDNRIANIPVAFFRAIWKKTALLEMEHRGVSENVMTACETSVIPLSIWYFNTGASQTVDKNVLKSGWNALYELYQQWLQETSRSEDCETASNIQWDPVIREVHSNGYLFEALTTDTSLILEGERMQHCIAIYADRCREEMVRCFSVYKTSTGEHIGSLAVEETAPGTWEIEDLKGYENVDLDEDVQIAAMSVVTLFEEQHCISRRKRHSISEQLQSGWLTTEIRNRLSTLLEELQEYRPDSWDRKFVEDMTNYHKSLSRKQTDQLIRLLPDDDLAIEF